MHPDAGVHGGKLFQVRLYRDARQHQPLKLLPGKCLGSRLAFPIPSDMIVFPRIAP
jgi:hypothetical protein